jgi:hypothetical protein
MAAAPPGLATALLLLAIPSSAAADASMNFGPPISAGGGGKMSNTLSLYPAGFASGGFRFSNPVSEGVVFSADGAATYHKAQFNMSVNQSWDSFVVYDAGTPDVWGHDFGTYHECIPGHTLNGAHATATSVTSQPTTTFKIVNGQLTQTLGGPPVTFADLTTPDAPICGPPKDDPAFVGITVYAGGQMVLPDGTHLVTAMYPICAPGKTRDGNNETPTPLFSSQLCVLNLPAHDFNKTGSGPRFHETETEPRAYFILSLGGIHLFSSPKGDGAENAFLEPFLY